MYISMNRVDLDGGDLVIGIMRDTTEQKIAIAEHVEDEAVLEKLKGIGVIHAQGYAIHKPEALV
jgi:EAL domain-containing protein (putative c-di-GMP-specific phosphodiesterase class I)